MERLRTASSLAQALPACRGAADRIEQLEAALRNLIEAMDKGHRAGCYAQERARAALAPEQEK
jgi:hypothetical protein